MYLYPLNDYNHFCLAFWLLTLLSQSQQFSNHIGTESPLLGCFNQHYAAETQSGLPLLPWSCYASVIQCDIIQYLLFLFYYNTGIISFLAIYNNTILCTIFCVSERLYAKKTLFLTCYDVALLFWVFCKHVCFNVHE